jgi:hypothetical protein
MADLIKALGFEDEINADVLHEEVTKLAISHILEFPNACVSCSEQLDGRTVVLHDNELYCKLCYDEINKE